MLSVNNAIKIDSNIEWLQHFRMKAIAIIGMLLMNYTLTKKFLVGVKEDQEDSVGTDYRGGHQSQKDEKWMEISIPGSKGGF